MGDLINIARRGSSQESVWITCSSSSSSSGRNRKHKQRVRLKNSPSSSSSESNCSDKKLLKVPKSVKFLDPNENLIKFNSQKKSKQKPPIDLDDSTCYWIRSKLPKEFRNSSDADSHLDCWFDHCYNTRGMEDAPIMLTPAHQLDPDDHYLPYVGIRKMHSRRKDKTGNKWARIQKLFHQLIRLIRNLLSYIAGKK